MKEIWNGLVYCLGAWWESKFRSRRICDVQDDDRRAEMRRGIHGDVRVVDVNDDGENRAKVLGKGGRRRDLQSLTTNSRCASQASAPRMTTSETYRPSASALRGSERLR